MLALWVLSWIRDGIKHRGDHQKSKVFWVFLVFFFAELHNQVLLRGYNNPNPNPDAADDT